MNSSTFMPMDRTGFEQFQRWVLVHGQSLTSDFYRLSSCQFLARVASVRVCLPVRGSGTRRTPAAVPVVRASSPTAKFPEIPSSSMHSCPLRALGAYMPNIFVRQFRAFPAQHGPHEPNKNRTLRLIFPNRQG